MARVIPPAVRERCPSCRRPLAYMPLGVMCLTCGYSQSYRQSRRVMWTVLLCIGIALGVLFGLAANAEAEDEIVITDPMYTACRLLEPYSWAWYALYCDKYLPGEGLTAENIEIDADGVVTVEREYADGSRRVFTGRKVKR